MRSASESGLLVKDAHLRSVPEQHDKSIHLAQTLDKDFPKSEDRYRLSANSLKAADKNLNYTPDELAAFRKLQNDKLTSLAQRCKIWDEKMKGHIKSPDTVKELNRNINVALVAVLIDALDLPR